MAVLVSDHLSTNCKACGVSRRQLEGLCSLCYSVSEANKKLEAEIERSATTVAKAFFVLRTISIAALIVVIGFLLLAKK